MQTLLRKQTIVVAIGICCIIGVLNTPFGYGSSNSQRNVITVRARHVQTPRLTDRIRGSFLPISSQPFFILVIGNDYRHGVEGKRADAIHLVGVNPESKKATILNFPRDTNVDIPGHNRNKINAANAFGGSALTAQTLEQLTGVTISYIIEADFAAYIGLINDLGGIDISVDKPMHDSGSGTDFNPGTHHMNGDQALAFARDRHSFPIGDLQRTQNQATVLISALAEMKKTRTTVSSRFEAIGLMKRHLALTNLTLRDLYFLMELASNIEPSNISSILVPWSGSNTLSSKATDLFTDFRDNAIIDTYTQ